MGRPGGPAEAKRAADQGLVSADGDVGADICAGRETEDHGGYLSRRVTRLFVCLRKYPPIWRQVLVNQHAVRSAPGRAFWWAGEPGAGLESTSCNMQVAVSRPNGSHSGDRCSEVQ